MKRLTAFFIFISFALLTLFTHILVSPAFATTTAHLFYSQSCPHCKQEINWFENTYLPTHPDVSLIKYEVLANDNNLQRLDQVKQVLNSQVSSVPYLIIGQTEIIGFDKPNTTGKQIEATLDFYRQFNSTDLVTLILEATSTSRLLTAQSTEITTQPLLPFNASLSAHFLATLPTYAPPTDTLTLSVIGEINPRTISLPLISALIGAVDGFNPCAMWILVFLISMLFGMKDRRKMWVLGLTFLTTSALVYLLFMVSWLNLAIFTSNVLWIRLIIALAAIIFGGFNLKNWWQSRNQDGCVVVKSSKRQKIIGQIRELTSQTNFLLALSGVIVLAIGVNVIELMCSLGLPVAFTQVLAINDVAPLQYTLYLLIYIFFFLIDDIIVFFIAMKTLQITTASGKYTKYSHLIGGLIMIIIGLLMLFKYEWLTFNF
jgi:glutaredoxin